MLDLFDSYCYIMFALFYHHYHIVARNRSIENTIINEMLDGYNPQAFPHDDDKPLDVRVSYYPVQLLGLVSK